MKEYIQKRIRENLNENEHIKNQLVKSMGLSHSSHNVWNDRSGNQFKWAGSKFEQIPKNESEMLKNKEIVLSEYPTAKITPVAKNPNVYGGPMIYHVTYEKNVRGKIKTMSIGKGDSIEEAWERAKMIIDVNKKSSTKKDVSTEEGLNNHIIDKIEKIKAERNWNALGSLQRGQVEKFAQKISFDKDDIGTRVKAARAATWDDLMDIIKKSKLKMGFNG